ncbi:hypothetical protein [Microbacterium caowuchunii]|uniref:hypothetical protein n=1 Tax=Microbacterium caowuchunii TaxID=2614638 RepID=UPI001931005A|nr:hypothetical protein [Microbacterium caowuchunii]
MPPFQHDGITAVKAWTRRADVLPAVAGRRPPLLRKVEKISDARGRPSSALLRSVTDMNQEQETGSGKNGKGTGIGVGIALGLSVGVAVGIAADNLALWLAVGLAIGIAFGAIFDSRQKKQE